MAETSAQVNVTRTVEEKDERNLGCSAERGGERQWKAREEL
jgi:hypothetical protein